MTRLDAYDTVTLPAWLLRTGVASFFQEHAMEHLHWMAMFITEHRHLVKKDELFYERGTARKQTTIDVVRENKRLRLRTTPHAHNNTWCKSQVSTRETA